MSISACPDDDVLLAFVEHRAVRPDDVEAHLDACASCRCLVAELAALKVAERPPLTTLTLMMPLGAAAPATATSTATALGMDLGTTGAPVTMGPEAPLAKGTRVERYVVERELGRGGMGVVLAAHDPELDRHVALKILRPGGGEERARERLLREARAMAKLSHPNVVAIHDVGELGDGRIFLAMELVRGTTLRHVLFAPARPLSETLDLFLQAGRGLAAAHAAGLVHRDFKPDNVLVGNDGRVRVTDFGLARIGGNRDGDSPISVAPSSLSAAGVVAGTPAYMAPEQHVGAEATAKVDQFAFGLALFEALTGSRGYSAPTYEDLAVAKLEGRRKPWPSGIEAFVPDWLRAVVDRACATRPEHRFGSMQELLAILESHRAIETTRRAPAIPAPPQPPPPPLLPLAPKPKASHGGAIALGAIALAVVTGLGALAATRAGALSKTERATPGKCQPGAVAMGRVWGSPGKKEEIASVLAARGTRPSVVRRTVEALDAHVAAWTEMHDRSCAAAREGQESEEIYRARASCLRRRHNEIVATIETLSTETVGPEAAFRRTPLTPISVCASDAAVIASFSEPDPKTSANVDRVFLDIARLRSSRDTMRSAADAVVTAAEGTRDLVARGEALLLRAEIARSEDAFEEALLAAQASRDDGLIARGWVRRTEWSMSLDNARAAERAAAARAALKRVERPDLEVDLLSAEMRHALRRGAFVAMCAASRELTKLRQAHPRIPARPDLGFDVARELGELECSVEIEDVARAKTALDAATRAVTELDAPREDHAALAVLEARLRLLEGPAMVQGLFDRAEDAEREARAEIEAALARLSFDPVAKERRRVLVRVTRHRLLAQGRVDVIEGREKKAAEALDALVRDIAKDGFGIEPVVSARALIELSRIEREGAPARAAQAVRLVDRQTDASVLVEALLAEGAALAADGRAKEALAAVSRAEVIARVASPLRVRVDVAVKLVEVARSLGPTDPSGLLRAEEMARRTLDETPKDLANRPRLEALLAKK